MLVMVVAAPVLASPPKATRTIPASVALGTGFDVAIEASGCGIFGQVEETLPDGFTYISCTPSDIGVRQAGNTIQFTFLEDSASFTYRVKAPNVAATTTYTFHGVVMDEDRNEYPIEDNDITVTVGGPVTYILTMRGGSTTPSWGNHMYDAGDIVNISVTAGPGWRFDHWSSNVADPYSASTTVTMDSDKTVTAYFSPKGEANFFPIYTLKVAYQPSQGGSVTLSPTGWIIGVHEPSEGVTRSTYDADTSVELTATPSEGYVFSCWGGDLSGSTNPITIIMDSNKSVIANFVLSASERPASFAVSPVSISPEQVQPNQAVNISVNIANNGEEAESYQAALYVNGQLEDSRMVSIPPGSSQNVVFSITKATPGTYAVSLGGQQGQFTVVGSQSASDRLDIGTTIAIVVIVVLIAALVFVFRKVRKRA